MVSANTHFEEWWFKTFYINTAEAAFLHKLHSVSFQWKLAFLFRRIGVGLTLKRLVVTGYKQHELGIFDDKHPGIVYIKKAIINRFLNYFYLEETKIFCPLLCPSLDFMLTK